MIVPSLRARLAGDNDANVLLLCLLAAYHAAGWAMVVGGAPSIVLDLLGPITHVVWTVMLLAGPALSVAGLGWAEQWAGTSLRVAGGLAVLGGLGVLWVALIRSAGLLAATTWIVAGLVAATLWILVRDLALLLVMDRTARGR